MSFGVENLKIGVIGAGSIGLLFANLMAEKHQVTVVANTIIQAEKINDEGIIRVRNGSFLPAKVSAVAFSEARFVYTTFDLLFVAVKERDVAAVIDAIRDVKVACVFLQNGLAHVNKVSKLTVPAYLGIVEHGARRLDLNVVEHTGTGILTVGSLRPVPAFDFQSVYTFDFPIVISKDILVIANEKLIMNAVINPLTAYFNVTNGELMTDQQLAIFTRHVFEEVCDILAIKDMNIRLRLYNKLKGICENTASNHSSMLQDIERNRETEIDSILGYLCQLAKKNDAEAPLCNTVYALIKKKEKEFQDDHQSS